MAIRFLLSIGLLLASARVALAHDAGSYSLAMRPVASGNVALPLGNPLTAPLAMSPAEEAVFADRQWSGEELISAALVAARMEEPTRLSHYRIKYRQLSGELLAAAKTTQSPEELVVIIHRLLHRRVFIGGYWADQNSLATTFDTGSFNCATATVLFVALAQDAGLNAAACEMPGHVRAVVRGGQDRCEIEVTCPAQLQAIRWTSDAISQSGGSMRAVSPRGLVAMIYYNRGVDAFHEKRFADSIAANRRALLLDPANAVARGNLLAALNNWSLALAAAGNIAAAEELLTYGRQYAPDHRPFAHNARHIAGQR